MAKYDEILEEIRKRQQYANAELNTAQDVINYAQNNGKSYQRLNEEYLESTKKTKESKNWMESTAKKGNVALSNNYQAPTAQSMLSANVSKKPWERIDKPTTDVGVRVQQEKDELERQQDYYNKNIANSEQYKDYMNRTNKINPILEYSKNVAQVREQGLSGADKAFAPLLSGLDNIRDLGGSFVQSNGTRVSLPSLNDIKTQKAIEESNNWLYKGYADVTQSIGNMLPGIALNAIPGAGTALGTAYFGLSTYGNARNQALLDGYDEKSATTYGIINSALELGVGKVLGGASALLGKSPASKLLGEKLTSKIVSNPVLNSVVSDMVSEFGEEYIQEWLDPKVQAYVLEHKDLAEAWDSSKFFDKQNFYAGLLGAISAGITNAPNAIKQNINVKNQFESIVETLEKDGNEKLTEEQVKQLKETFYNEYNKAIKNNTELNYNDVVNNANIEANTNVETQTEENIMSNIEELKAKQKETKDNKLKQELATKIANLEQQVEEINKKINLPMTNTKGMNLRESASLYNINPQTQIAVQQLMENRGIESRWDATKFKDNSVNALWTKDANGNRQVIFNPNASLDTVIEEVAIHELTHDILSSENTTLNSTEILDYVKTLDDYESARASLEKTYRDVYDPNSLEFQSIIDEEVVADVLGRKLGNQEFINNLVNKKPSLAKKIYDWVVQKLNTIINKGKVRNETIFWASVKNNFENAYKKSYNNSAKEAITRYKATPKNNPYGHNKEFLKLSEKVQKDAHNAIEPVATEMGAKGKLYGSATDVNGNTYDFEIHSDMTYTITNVQKYKENIKEVAHETNPNTNSRNSMESSIDERSNNDINNGNNRNRGTSQENVEISSRERKQQGDNGYRLPNTKQETTNRELDSSFSLDKNAKRYDDLTKTKYIEYFVKDNGDVRINLMDSNNNLVNQFDLYNQREAIKELGEELGKQIYQSSSVDYQIYEIGNDINNMGTETDYFMNHRPTETGAYASDISDNGNLMSEEVYEHPEYYYNMDKSHKESFEVLKSIRNNPDAEITIYRATPGDKINKGDWITLSKTYAEQHNQSRFDGKANVLEKKVKAKDIQFAGDDINEFGYYPNMEKYSKESEQWDKWKNTTIQSEGTKTKLGDIKLPGKIATKTKISENKINDHTLEYKGYYIMPPKPNTNYEYESLENAKRYSIYDANNDDITHNIANNVDSIDFAKKYIDDIIELKEEKPKLSKIQTSLPMVKEQDVLKVEAKQIADEINGISTSDTNQRRWIGTSTKSDVLKDKILIEDLNPDKINYVVESNKKSVDTANNYLDVNGYEKSLSHVKELLTSDTLPKASDVALAERVLQEAVKNGDAKTAQDLLMDIAILGTDLGQATQALSIIKKLTPEGQLRMYTKIIQRAKSRGEKAFKDVKITTDMVQNVLDAYNSDGTYDQKDLNNRVEQFKQQIADQMKTTKGEKINAWRYLSMLGNPKTHIRNIVSNVAMNGTIKVKNAMARTLESVLPIKNRTKTWKQATDYIKNYSKQIANDMKDIITGENKYNEKSSLESKKQIFKSKTLEKLANFNSNALEAEDWFFSKRAFQSTLQEYLTANGINTEADIKNNPEIVEKAKNYAVEQAEIATFRQYSKLASQINSLEKNNKIARLAIEATVPFKKTPINVAKAGVKYSPLGLIKSLSYDAYQVAHGNMEASQFIDNLSQGMTGTSLALLGYALAKAGILNGAGGEDKDDKYDSQLGDNQYSIKIGDKSYSISWLSPVAMPLLVGANAYEQLEEKEEWDMNVVSETLAKTLDPLNEMSFMSGLTNALTSYGSGVDKIKGSLESVGQNYVGQFFPTLFSQVASTLDDKKRSTKASNNSSYKFGEQTLRSIMYKLPGLRQQLEVATDIWGNEKEQADNIIQRAFDSFLAPYSATKNITSDLDKEIKNIYNKTGETGVIPSVPYSYVKYKDNTYRMSAEEYTKYKKTFGQSANKYLNNLINSNAYKNASDNDKAKMINNTYDYAKAVANEEYFKSQKIDYSSDTLKELNDLKKIGINDKSLADYISNKTLSSTISGDKTLTANEKHQKIANNLTKSGLNDKQLAYLYGKYYSTDEKLNNLITLNIPIKEFIKLNSQNIVSDYNKNTGATISGSKKQKIINYINSLNLSVAQKAILIKSQYNTFNNYNNEIVNYVNNLNKTVNDKKVLLKSIGFDNYDKDVINYINSQNLTKKQKEEKLKSLGFTIRDGRVYSK